MKTLSNIANLIAASALPQVNVLRIASATSDTETITVGSTVFEFDTDSTVTAGNVAVDISGGATAADSRTAIIAAFEANGIQANNLAGEYVVVWLANQKPGQSLATSETMAGLNNQWEAAATYGGEEPSENHKITVQASRAVSAAEATAQVFAVAFRHNVLSATVDIRSSAGVPQNGFDGAVTFDGGAVLVSSSGATDLASGDIVTVTAVLDMPAP